MVDGPFSVEAAAMAADLPNLSVGLHVTLTNENGRPLIDLRDSEQCRAQLSRQFARFTELVGREPTHLDSHHNVHLRHPQVLPSFTELAEPGGLLLRGHPAISACPGFYGRVDGTPKPEQIEVESLEQILESKVNDGLNLIACHPGYVDEHLESPYSLERELELRTLCDPRIRQQLQRLNIELISFAGARRLLSVGTI
jgi:predicted glycoside hydrolase/deacetylase ChbG (UPF0249 family)